MRSSARRREELQPRAHGANLRVGEELRAMAGMLLAKSLRDQKLHRLLEKLAARVAEDLFGLRVDQNDVALLIDDQHGVWRGLQKALEFLLGFLAFGDVPNGARDQHTFVSFEGAQADFNRK